MKKGFTLIELLAVITILAVIFLVVTPAVGKSVKNSRIKSQANKEEAIFQSTERYLVDNGLTDHGSQCISIDDLKINGYLKNETITNVVTGDNLDNYYVVALDDGTGKHSYSLNSVCNLHNTIMNPYDVSGNRQTYFGVTMNYDSIQNIIFTRDKREGTGINVSEDGNSEILLYIEPNGETKTINRVDVAMNDLYIYSKSDIQAPADCTSFFNMLSYVDSINFNDMFDTSNVTNMKDMFDSFGSLGEMTTLDLGSNFTKIAVTNSDMFKDTGKENCTIKVPASIYQDSTHFKVTGGSTIEYTRGTIQSAY